MGPPIVFDGLRLLLDDLTDTPRGIDRIDYGYARFLFNDWHGDCYGIIPTPWGVRLFDRDRVQRLLASVQALWRENHRDGADPALTRLRNWLANGNVTNCPPVATTQQHRGLLALAIRSFKNNGLSLGRSAIREAPRNAIYLNVGQLGWAAPVATHWLQRRPDIRAVFMLHDVIPLQYPKLISFGGRMAQHWMLRAVISKAGGLIATTQAATETVKATLAARGLPAVPWATLHLPVDDVFLQQNTVDVGLTKHPYFVICGAIEPRKNHLLLLEVWQLLVRRLGRAAPRLVIIGSPAFSGHQILRQFYEAPSLQDHVIVLSGMASPSVRQAMANAKALLMPSLAEGFGLPVAEALAVGTPVLASDLPAHYEVGQDLATYLDPTDAVAWFDAIMELVEFDSKTSNLRQRISTYRPITQTSYFRSVQDFLLDLASNNCVART